MKVAIYSRIIEETERGEVQQLLDELQRRNIQPVIYLPFLKESVQYSGFRPTCCFFADRTTWILPSIS